MTRLGAILLFVCAGNSATVHHLGGSLPRDEVQAR